MKLGNNKEFDLNNFKEAGEIRKQEIAGNDANYGTIFDMIAGYDGVIQFSELKNALSIFSAMDGKGKNNEKNDVLNTDELAKGFKSLDGYKKSCKNVLKYVSAFMDDLMSVYQDKVKNNQETEFEAKENNNDNLETYAVISILKQTGKYKEYDKQLYDKAIQSIDKGNILSVINENITVLSANDSRTLAETNSDLRHLSEVLFELAKDYGIDTSDINIEEYTSEDITMFEEGDEFEYFTDGPKDAANFDKLKSLYYRIIDKQKELASEAAIQTFTYNNIDELKNMSVEKYKELEGKTHTQNIPDDFDFGDGSINKPSTQETGNCWAQADLNALASTEKGGKLLSSHMYRDNEHGITVIHLQEAENNGKGADGKGIYVITDDEIYEASKTLSSGDGDMTAYNVAILKYLQEIGEKQDLKGIQRGRKRVFEIISGIPYTGQGVRDWYGVESASYNLYDGKSCGIFRTSFDEVYDIAKNGTGATTIEIDSLRLSYWNGKGSHALSIVGCTDDGKLLVQESNNAGVYIDDLPQSEISYNGAPTYIMDKDFFQEKVNESTSFIWGNRV